MADDSTLRSDFKAIISPHLELLLQYSLWLTKNGLDATRLMREALVEASQSFNESPPERHWDMRVQEILTRRFLNGKTEHSDPIIQIRPDNIDESLVRNNVLFPVASDTDQKQLWLTAGSNSDESYLNAIAGLPAVCRSAMILSYLEGFSTEEIADLSGVQTQAIESLLGRGRRFIREQLFLHLIGDESAETSPKREAESA
jgi:RNA polymerase sigma factor (sigma-70 family)